MKQRLREWKNGEITKVLINQLEYRKDKYTRELLSGALILSASPLEKYARITAELKLIEFILQGEFLGNQEEEEENEDKS